MSKKKLEAALDDVTRIDHARIRNPLGVMVRRIALCAVKNRALCNQAAMGLRQSETT